MKHLFTLTFLVLSVAAFGQKKQIATVPDTKGIATYFSNTEGASIYVQLKSDTIECYFLKVPAVVEFELQPINAQWYHGYAIEEFNKFTITYLYFDKSPVKEQVLISIPKRK